MKLPPKLEKWPYTSHKLSEINSINKKTAISPASIFSINQVLNENCQRFEKESIIDVLLKGKLVNNKIFQKHSQILNEKNINSYNHDYRSKSSNYQKSFNLKKRINQQNQEVFLKTTNYSKNNEINKSLMIKKEFLNISEMNSPKNPFSNRKINSISTFEKESEKKANLNSKYKKIMEVI